MDKIEAKLARMATARFELRKKIEGLLSEMPDECQDCLRDALCDLEDRSMRIERRLYDERQLRPD